MNNPKSSTRRKFLYKGGILSTAILYPHSLISKTIELLKNNVLNSKFFGVQIGVITYSFRSMPQDVNSLIQYCKDCNINAIELMGEPIEQHLGKPKRDKSIPYNSNSKEMKDYRKNVIAWRTNISMKKFKEIKKLFNNNGIKIYAFKPNALRKNNTDAEIEYALKAGKSLGASHVTVEIPKDSAHSLRLGKLAEKNKMHIAYHAHTQASDYAWDIAMDQSPYNAINLDCGHYIAAGGKNTQQALLNFIIKNNKKIMSMHIKDRSSNKKGKTDHPWGEGETPISEILKLLKEKQYKIPASIELEYTIPKNSNAVKEVKKCLNYAKNALST